MPTADGLVAALGPGSRTFEQLYPELLALYRRVADAPEVAVRYRQWQHCLSLAYGSPVGDDALFIRHTCLAIVARFVARCFVEPGVMPVSPEELKQTVNGDYFREQGIVNFIEDDFFTWLLLPAAAGDGIDLVRRLAHSLAVYDFSRAQPGLLKGLYEGLVDPETRHDLGEHCTPDWLAEYMLDGELGLSQSPDRSVFDPACGAGTFLFIAIRLIIAARLQRGEDSLDILLHVLDQVMGVDVHPVAVTIARTHYLLALGELVRGPHPPVLLPVYLSNALVLPGSTVLAEYPEAVYTVHTGDPGLVFELPHCVVSNPEMLDWLFFRMIQYLNGAQQRARFQEREEAIQAVLAAFHNYLVSPKARTPIPEPLSAFAAEVMERTARRIIELCLEGHDHLWLFILKNLPASVYLAQRKFDLVVGNPPWLTGGDIGNAEPSRLFFARGADLYLKDASPTDQGGDSEGVIALVMPRAALNTGWMPPSLKLERVLDLEGVPPLFKVPACVLLARKEVAPGPPLQRGVGGISANATTYPVPGVVFRGTVPSRNASWQEAEPALERADASFDRQGGRLVPQGE